MIRALPRVLGLAVLLAVTACREARESREAEAPDAGVEEAVVRLEAHGLAVRLPPGWTWAPVEPEAPTTKRRSPSGASGALRAESPDVETLALAVRRPTPGAAPFRVAPRVVVTRETGEDRGEAAFSRILNDLKKIGDRPGVVLERTGFIRSSRMLDPRAGGARDAVEVGDIQLRYRVGELGPRVFQRSLVMLFYDAPARFIVTLTSTYLEEDRSTVEGELEHLYQSLELFQPVPPDGSGSSSDGGNP